MDDAGNLSIQWGSGVLSKKKREEKRRERRGKREKEREEEKARFKRFQGANKKEGTGKGEASISCAIICPHTLDTSEDSQARVRGDGWSGIALYRSIPICGAGHQLRWTGGRTQFLLVLDEGSKKVRGLEKICCWQAGLTASCWAGKTPHIIR